MLAVPDAETRKQLWMVLQRWCPRLQGLDTREQAELINRIALGIGRARLWPVTALYGIPLFAALLFATNVVSAVIQSAERGQYYIIQIMAAALAVAATILFGRLLGREIRRRSVHAFVGAAVEAMEVFSLDCNVESLAAAGEDYYYNRWNPVRPAMFFPVATTLLFLCLLPFRDHILGADGGWPDLFGASAILVFVLDVVAGASLYFLGLILLVTGYKSLAQRCCRGMAKWFVS